ncbi:MAG: TIGR00366 family protein [Paracoccaceae bacterium]|uniref:short-chain fatty acid transporter n=1 Tax=Rhodobacterales TaxID=204455 RepID=UPI0032983BBC
MLNSLSKPFVRVVERWMPDPFIFAALLTLLTFLLAITLAGQSPIDAVNGWGGKFWSLTSFTTQIAMTLLTGYALANTPFSQKCLKGLVGLVSKPFYAYAMVCFVAGVGSLVSWAIGLIVGAFLARETARACKERGMVVHFPLLVASGYAGFVLFGQGLSSSIALKVAETDHFLVEKMGVLPASETIFSNFSMAVVLLVLITLPLIMAATAPKSEACIQFSGAEIDEATSEEGEGTPAHKISSMRLWNLLIGGLGLAFLVSEFVIAGKGLTLNLINMVFLVSGILLTSSPLHYVRLMTEGGKTLGPILLQYPFYAGIMGLMASSGLTQIFSGWVVAFASAETLPFWSMISAGFVNLFVPSAGGQWAVQGPIMIDAAQQLGADINRVTLGVAMGDQWSNMIQPFFTIPALAIAGLHVRHIMGYCFIAFIWTGLIFGTALLLF